MLIIKETYIHIIVNSICYFHQLLYQIGLKGMNNSYNLQLYLKSDKFMRHNTNWIPSYWLFALITINLYYFYNKAIPKIFFHNIIFLDILNGRKAMWVVLFMIWRLCRPPYCLRGLKYHRCVEYILQ